LSSWRWLSLVSRHCGWPFSPTWGRACSSYSMACGCCVGEMAAAFYIAHSLEERTMHCPVCKEVLLVMSERQNVEIDYCPQCRGVWLDRGELDKDHRSVASRKNKKLVFFHRAYLSRCKVHLRLNLCMPSRLLATMTTNAALSTATPRRSLVTVVVGGTDIRTAIRISRGIRKSRFIIRNRFYGKFSTNICLDTAIR